MIELDNQNPSRVALRSSPSETKRKKPGNREDDTADGIDAREKNPPTHPNVPVSSECTPTQARLITWRVSLVVDKISDYQTLR